MSSVTASANSSVLIVGSLGLDNVTTPFGMVEGAVGGAGMYAGTAASLLAPVNLVGVVGEDFPPEALQTLAERGVDLAGVQHIPGGRSFRWSGSYEYAMNEAHTHATELNVFADFNPVLPQAYRNSEFVFLANIMPSLQLQVLDQIGSPRFTVCDTMNYWIQSARDELIEVLGRVDMALMNDAEARQLTGVPNLARAAEQVLELGPRHVVIKQGEYGAVLVDAHGHFALPCYPLPNVVDPTGAGDSFAGGLIGLLAWLGACDEASLRQALAIGTVLASACVEDFSLAGLHRVDVSDIYGRYEELRHMVQFDGCPLVV